MSGFLIAVLSVGVILGFMILIHEFGHYAAAKLLGVRVEQFSPSASGNACSASAAATPTTASPPSRWAATSR